MPEHILVLGSTGSSGIEFCYIALQQGHRLTLYVRRPHKLPKEIASNADVTVIEGTFEDATKLEQVVRSGPQFFVSFAGPSAMSTDTHVTNAMKLIFPMLVANKYKRAMVLGTCSYTAPQDKGALKWKLCVALVKAVGRTGYLEFKGLGDFIASQDVNQLPWTLFRVPFLTNGAEGPVNATYTGYGDDGLFLSRKSMVRWVLQEMHKDSWIGKAPTISNR